jgi:hypothetical protein
MILGFKKTFPWGEPTFFKEKIWSSFETTNYPQEKPKLHSIRAGERWQPGMFMHLAYGVRTKKYECFQLATVKTVQRIIISARDKRVLVATRGIDKSYFIDFLKLNEDMIEDLAKNDGFDSVTDFWKWFDQDMSGQIISWTGKLYL